MICAPLTQSRIDLARERIPAAMAAMGECRICAHDCGVNRVAGQRGPCGAGMAPRFFSAQVEVADELELVPTFALALSGCDLRCDFCITGASSWNTRAGQPFDPLALASLARRALAEGARTVMVLGGEPTIHLPWVLPFVAELPQTARLVWKTNGHGTSEARALLDGLFDVWLVDYKFGNDTCAKRLAGIPDYSAIVRENLFWANQNSELIVRHLLMPGHIECCWRPAAEWLAANLPGVKVSLRTGFWPAWHSARHPELLHAVATPESQRANALGRELGLNLIP